MEARPITPPHAVSLLLTTPRNYQSLEHHNRLILMAVVMGILLLVEFVSPILVSNPPTHHLTFRAPDDGVFRKTIVSRSWRRQFSWWSS